MNQTFFGEKLRLARQFYGMTLADLGDRTGVSRQFVQQLESDAKYPNTEMIEALAAALGVEAPYFLEPIRNSVKVEQTHFRKLRSTPVSLVQQVLAHGTMLEQLVSYFDQRLTLPEVNFPERQARANDEIEDIADECRDHWGLSESKPIQNMTRVLENAGAVVVYFENLSEKIDALSMNRARPIVVRSTTKESLCRMRYDLAHECGHLVMHQGIETGDEKTEKQANKFAGAFLLPRISFKQEFPATNRLDWRSIFAMKLKWKVSAQAIVTRAYDLKIIDAAQHKRAFVQLQRNGQRKKEKFDDILPLEKSELLERCFGVLRENGRLYFSGIAKDLKVKPDFLRKMVAFTDLPELRDSPDGNATASFENVVQFFPMTNTN